MKRLSSEYLHMFIPTNMINYEANITDQSGVNSPKEYLVNAFASMLYTMSKRNMPQHRKGNSSPTTQLQQLILMVLKGRLMPSNQLIRQEQLRSYHNHMAKLPCWRYEQHMASKLLMAVVQLDQEQCLKILGVLLGEHYVSLPWSGAPHVPSIKVVPLPKLGVAP